MKSSFFVFLLLLFLLPLSAQDTLIVSTRDSALQVQSQAGGDTSNQSLPTSEQTIRSRLPQTQSTSSQADQQPPLPIKPKAKKNEDWLFYYLLSVLMIFALILASQRKYFSDLFRVFFRTSLRVNQIREQLLQSDLPSLLFNLFFFISAGTFIFLILRYGHHPPVAHPYQLLAATILFTAALYAGKFMIIHFSGWIFGIQKITETYLFIVFMINKVIGVLLIPFLIVIAFSPRPIAVVMETLALALVGILFLYRFLRAFGPVSRETKISRFHFLLYLLGFEVAPLLVIYRLFTRYFYE